MLLLLCVLCVLLCVVLCVCPPQLIVVLCVLVSLHVLSGALHCCESSHTSESGVSEQYSAGGGVGSAVGGV